MIFENPIVVGGRGLSIADLRHLAQAEPEAFVQKIQAGITAGKLKFSDFGDMRALYQSLADITVKHGAMQNGIQRTISSSAFPVLLGTTAVAAIQDSYTAVPSIGAALVTEFEDSKKVTTIANIETLGNQVDEVKEGEDFPLVGAKEEMVQIRHRKNGRRIQITVETIMENDMFDIVSRLNKIGELAGEQVEELTLKRVTDYDGSKTTPSEYAYFPDGTGTTLFSATANTPGTRAPSGTRYNSNALVDDSDLDNVRSRLASMLNDRGKRIMIPYSERVVLVPDALIGTLNKICNSEYVPGVENEVSNWGPRGQWYIPPERRLSSPKVDDLSTSAWYYGTPKRQFKRKWKMNYTVATLGMDTESYLRSHIAFQASIGWDCEIAAVDYVYWVQCLSSTTAPADE